MRSPPRCCPGSLIDEGICRPESRRRDLSHPSAPPSHVVTLVSSHVTDTSYNPANTFLAVDLKVPWCLTFLAPYISGDTLCGSGSVAAGHTWAPPAFRSRRSRSPDFDVTSIASATSTPKKYQKSSGIPLT
ncbi:hypothetical protein NDU88_005253 [Pleurodeles waltl]|uniref:Uncharacterized protein n=1 Tax=Pleurodeles waltl TaxID=8319 RepID=A0AAV7WBC1_PLEWA|nr:hypothetical protein NDU88_005253 [Pleurodeles waltl]